MCKYFAFEKNRQQQVTVEEVGITVAEAMVHRNYLKLLSLTVCVCSSHV